MRNLNCALSPKSAMATFAIALLLVGCKGKGSQYGDFPSDFQNKTTSEKMAYMMEHTTPDSVARFICNVAIDRIPGVKIDSLTEATLYAYEHYTGKDLESFQNSYDAFSDDLPLSEKMKLYFRASLEGDPIQMGYQLGLEYPSRIREKKMTVDQVKGEIDAFRKACGNDRDTYGRFLQGFKIALQEDRGKDLSEDIYHAFINYR